MEVLTWQGRTSRKAFRDRFVAAARERWPAVPIEPEAGLGCNFTTPEGRARVTLERAYTDFLVDPRRGEEILSRWLDSVEELLREKRPIERSAIVPMLKHRRWLEAPGAAASTVRGLCYEPYNDELIIVYAEDGGSLRYRMRSDFKVLGLRPAALRALAIENLRTRARDWKVEPHSALQSITVGDSFEASLLLLDDVWSDSRIAVQGELLAGVPDRDTLAIAGSEDATHVWELAVATHGIGTKARYPISPNLFHRRERKFEVLDPVIEDRAHPITNVGVINIIAERKGGGASLIAIIASPLEPDPRSVVRLFRKLNGYLDYLQSKEHTQKYGPPSAKTTDIQVHLHHESATEMLELLDFIIPWVYERNAALHVELI